MITKIKNIVVVLLSIFAFTYVGCRKFETEASKNETTDPNWLEEKFFNSHRTYDSTEISIVEFLKRSNNKANFVQQAIKQVGYPRWDKSILSKNNSVVF